MRIKYQVAGAETTSCHTGWPITSPGQRITQRTLNDSDQTVSAWRLAAIEEVTVPQGGTIKKIYTQDTHSVDYIVIGIRAALPPKPRSNPR